LAKQLTLVASDHPDSCIQTEGRQRDKLLRLDENQVKQKLAGGDPVLGVVCRSLSPVVVELIGLSRFDFVWIDMEHTTADFTTVEQLCRAADAVGIETLVRVPDQNVSSIVRVLEAGAAIVNVPQVNSRSEAEAVVKAAKYHPLGNRGLCSSSRGNLYGFAGKPRDVFSAANRRVMTMVQIESQQGVESAPEICSVPDLDIIFIGMADLSQSFGCPGELAHPAVIQATRQVLAAIRQSGKAAAMLVEDADHAKSWMVEGVRMLCCGVDIPLIGAKLQETRRAFDLTKATVTALKR
jgi:2-keto-3-deoxy-L-rhamnonate aldolase RhmA